MIIDHGVMIFFLRVLGGISVSAERKSCQKSQADIDIASSFSSFQTIANICDSVATGNSLPGYPEVPRRGVPGPEPVF